MKRVFIGGYYGYGNLGDELILAAIVARLRALRPGLEISVTSADPTETADRHAVDAVGWFDMKALVGAAETSHAVLLGGGGLFHDYWGCDPDALLQRHHAALSQYLALPLLASLLDKPFMIYGVGVGPLLSELGRQLTSAAFDQAAVATVRDGPSRALLAEIGVDTGRVEVTADPAFDFALPPAAEGEAAWRAAGHAPRRPLVAVGLRNWWHGALNDYWERQVAEGLDLFLDRRGGEAVFIPFQKAPEPFGDAPVAERVRKLMKPGRHHALGTSDAPAARVAVLAGCDLVVGMRLHALVVGARAGRPLVGLAYDPKVGATMASLGVTEHQMDLGAITSRALAERLDDAWQRRGEIGPRLAAVAGELAGRARVNAEKAVEMLDRPPTPPAAGRTAALLKRTTLRVVAQLAQKDASLTQITDERRQLQVRAENAEAELRRWETSKTGRLMRVWRRLRSRPGASGSGGPRPGP